VDRTPPSCRARAYVTSASDQTTRATSISGWIVNQPYLLLVLSQLFWAGNIIVGRGIAEEIPPVLLSLIRWAGAFLLILPWALPQLKTDWRTLRTHLGFMVLLAFTGISTYNTLSYWGLGHTQALNALLMQSSTPLFLALWSLVLFGIRLTGAQMAGIALSLAGVLTIVVHGDFASLRDVDLNVGDIAFLVALAVFGLTQS